MIYRLNLEGRVARGAHKFANEQWSYICKNQGSIIGQMAEKIPDGMPLISKNRIIVSEFPIGEATEFQLLLSVRPYRQILPWLHIYQHLFVSQAKSVYHQWLI